MLRVLEERDLAVDELRPMSSARSAGSRITFQGELLQVLEAAPDAFADLDVVIFSAGSRPSRQLAPAAVSAGAVVVDNSAAWRLEPDVPLVVPEVNPEAAADTYQAASGAGRLLVDELQGQRRALAAGNEPPLAVYPHVLEGNAVPGGWIMDPEMTEHAPPVYEDAEAAFAYNQEELKIVAETRKILGLPTLAIACTSVRVPVVTGHSEAVWIETEATLRPVDVRACLEESAGILVQDDPKAQIYPLALNAAGTDDVYVGRIRRDLSHERGIALWLAADNLRKGAATNAIQVVELLFS
jgi:aspartate-semialdehyde dehydrogenase